MSSNPIRGFRKSSQPVRGFYMNNILFSTKLDKNNIILRNHLIKIMSKYKNLPQCNFLDIGCGNGRFAVLLSPFVKQYYGIDLDKEYISLAKKIKIPNVKFKVGKAEKIPFDKKFDIIFYSFSWHFVKDHNIALEELIRISKKDSLIIILEPSLKPLNYRDPRLNINSKEFDKQR